MKHNTYVKDTFFNVEFLTQPKSLSIRIEIGRQFFLLTHMIIPIGGMLMLTTFPIFFSLNLCSGEQLE